MIFKRSHLFILFLFLLMSAAFIPKHEEGTIDKLVAALERWTNTNPQEKVYLHTDKPYYLVGDTIWFKAYLTIGSKHERSALSGALYVDLVSEGDSIAQTLKLPVIAGIASGNFVLGDSVIREGNYRIRAYTQWMRNAGPDYFYDQTFSVGNSVSNTVFAAIEYRYAEDDNNKVGALITYTDERGKPFADKRVSYQLKESYKIISSGLEKTNELGQISINLPNVKPGEERNAYLHTSFGLEAKKSISKSFPIRTAALQTDIQFFPEGGNLVNGLNSKVAFKAVGSSGLGIKVMGKVVDDQQQEVAQFESTHLGMGYFLMSPEAGKTYTAKINFPDGSVNTIKLPLAADEGYALAVYPNLESDSILVKIHANASTLKKEVNKLNLIGQSGGTVYFAAEVNVTKVNTSLYLPLKGIPSGILQFTIFSAEGNPLNERVVFVKGKDHMTLQVKAGKDVYQQNEKVELELEAKDSEGKLLSGNFSVSVMSMDAVPSDEANEQSIFSQLLLSSDVKGYIEKPNYYFHKPTAESNDNLDILMLTQGYRRFVWKGLLAGQQSDFAYKAESLTTDITGKLSTFGDKPVIDGKVTLVNNKLSIIMDTVTNQKGQFKFSNLLIPPGLEFTVQGRTAKNGKRLNIKVDKTSIQEITPNKNIGDINLDISKLTKASVENSRSQHMQLAKLGKFNEAQQLREVEISARKKRDYGSDISESQADEIFRPDSRNPCKTLKDCIEEMYKTKVIFEQKTDFSDNGCGSIWQPKGYVVIIDSMLVQPCDYQDFLLEDPSAVEKIYFSNSSPAIAMRLLSRYSHLFHGGSPPNVMAIYTKNRSFRKRPNPSAVFFKPKTFDTVKEFYSPKYDKPGSGSSVADLRSTIYWNPVILTDASGKVTFNFFNSNQIGNYRVVIEGIDKFGLLGRKVFTYKVTK